jgi:hypothetical protein
MSSNVLFPLVPVTGVVVFGGTLEFAGFFADLLDLRGVASSSSL